MNDLRQAAEMALEFVEWLCGDDHSVRPKNKALDVRKALRQALDVDAVNTTPDRVDETAKGEHEPLYMDMSQVPTGMPDWKPGMVFPAPKKEWVGLTDAEKEQATGWSVEHIEAKLKEKNGG